MNTRPVAKEHDEYATMLLLDQREHYFAQSAASVGGNVAEFRAGASPTPGGQTRHLLTNGETP